MNSMAHKGTRTFEPDAHFQNFLNQVFMCVCTQLMGFLKMTDFLMCNENCICVCTRTPVGSQKLRYLAKTVRCTCRRENMFLHVHCK